jgi:type II secretory ATPase GspE/PulE/Tfp pilus assembly ATPase PilB-like protein
VELSPNLAKTVPWQSARKDNIVPVQEIGNLLHIAMVDPEDPSIVDNLAFRTGKKIKVFLTGPESLKRAWQKLYGDIDKLDSDLLAKGMDSLRSKMIMKAKELSSDMSLVTKDYSKSEEEVDEKADEEDAKNQQIDNFDEIVEGAIDNVEVVDKAEEDVSSFCPWPRKRLPSSSW